MQSKVPKGLATWAAIVAAVGQYALAVALFLDTFDQADPLAGAVPLLTATATLWKMIDGRMKQASVLAGLDAAKAQQVAATQRAAQHLTQVTDAYSGVLGKRVFAGGNFRQDEDTEGEGDTTGCGA